MAGPDRRAAVTTALEENAAALLAYLVRRVDVPEDAADLLSDTFVVAWRRVQAVPSDPAEARMWLFGVARKVLLGHRRTWRRRTALQERLRAELGRSDAPAVPDAAAEVNDALRTLEPPDQEIVRLVYWDGFTLAEVSRLLGMREGTVRSRHHRARQRLKAALASRTSSA